MNKMALIIGIVIVVGFGVLAGFLLSKYKGNKIMGTSAVGKTVSLAGEKGVINPGVFKDTATGTLQKGGLGVDGTHKLIREGGPSQTVYLTSSIVDLDEFVDKKIEVHGQTVKAAKAAWLMDVGYVKIVQ